MLWSSHQIRKTFLEYFASKGHEVVESAPLVIKGDPTLMFTNAGMNQFKPIFLGNAEPSSLRVADTQKCLRVSGKHNDLEEVGKDHYHHTMFEMLGNWSFGDYFKKEAIEWAWELLTEVYKLDKDRLYVTVFEGDKELSLESDKEASELWSRHIESARIIPCNRKDNFWEMGDTGPCGPSSEIHIDLRTETERQQVDGSTLVNKDHPEVIEIWNLVFIQYNMLENGTLVPLKAKHIDTGMGLERLARALQQTQSNYDTDTFKALIQQIEVLTNVRYGGSDSKQDIAFRVIADHVRAIAFSIADGQLPSNTGSGYVIRRILRRAVRYAFSVLNQSEPLVFKVAGALIDEMGKAFPELSRNREIIIKVIEEEEKSFLQTLEKGLQKLGDYFQSASEKVLPGDFVFELYDTFGFPEDLTKLIASENQFSVDVEGFNRHLAMQKNRSRAASKAEFGDWEEVESGTSEFIGYDSLSVKTKLLRYRKVKQKGKEAYQVVLAQTPFYAESGGQVGDKGWLLQEDIKVPVFDTKKENDEIVHFLTEFPFDPKVGIEAQVNEDARSNTMKNHTATHLLHHALRKHLGNHVEQKGSMVSPDRLRFDFSHYERVSEEQLAAIVEEIESMIKSDVPLEEWRKMPIDQAKEMGAMALFGEKYGNQVRVIKFGDSVELCGGTHLKSTSNVDGFRLVSESSIASGIRRIEAITGDAYQEYLKKALDQFDEIGSLLGNPKDEIEALTKLIDDNKKLRKALDMAADREQKMYVDRFRGLFNEGGGNNFHVLRIDAVDGKLLKDAAYAAVTERDDAWIIVAGEKDEKPFVISALSKALVEGTELNAGNQVKEIAKAIDGGGGGQKHLAMAGGKNKQGLEKALVIAKEIQRIQAS